jgi:hypothetical protein
VPLLVIVPPVNPVPQTTLVTVPVPLAPDEHACHPVPLHWVQELNTGAAAFRVEDMSPAPAIVTGSEKQEAGGAGEGIDRVLGTTEQI